MMLGVQWNSCQNISGETNETRVESQKFKYKAIHLFARNEIDSFEIQKLKSTNINSIVIVPFLYQRGLNTDTVILPGRNSYEWTEREDGIIGMARLCQQNGLNLIVKPHIWPVNLKDGEWRESIMPDSTNWPGWSRAYENAMLYYARICEKEKVAMLSVGTELRLLAVSKPNFWRELIRKVRAVYSGKLTYAANWYQEYEEIQFWDELDYIGIQGYFPISSSDSSDLGFMKREWIKHCQIIQSISQQYDKPVLITEMGYKSSDKAGIEPWLWDEHWRSTGPNVSVSEEMQVRCYQSFFETIWKKDWCEGVFIWNWKSPYNAYGGVNKSTFTPQRKKAEKTIRHYFQ